MGRLEYWDELWFNFDRWLAKDPYLGQRVPGTLLWALPLNTNPPLTAYYRIVEDDRAVTLHYIAEA